MTQLAIEFEPVHNGTRTSRAAAESVRNHAVIDRQRILAFITDQGFNGATADEIERALKIPGNTVRPRMIELRLRLVADSGRTRATRSGRQAIVWWLNGENNQ